MGLVIYKTFPKRLYTSSTYSRNINSAHCFSILWVIYILSQYAVHPAMFVGRLGFGESIFRFIPAWLIKVVLGRDSAPETENGARWVTDTTKDTPNYDSSF